jgi:glycosyltransferase involved in cell wall biosynthesis
VRVVIDTTFALRGPSGTAVYLERLIPALRALGVEVVEAPNARRRRPGGGVTRSLANLVGDERWTQLELPRRASAAGEQLLHHPLPALSLRAPCPQVVTVHDLAFLQQPELFAPGYRRWAALAHRRAVRGADVVIAVSHTTALLVHEHWGLPDGRFVVAPHGPGQVREKPSRAEPGLFLYVGDAEPRKRVDLLLAAYASYRETAAEPLELVLAGASAAHAGAPGVRGEPDPDLAALHARAAALVHLATVEGFGLTVLEAMAWGTPVIAAPSEAVVELCEDAAVFVSGSRDDVAAALTRVGGDAALQADLRARGLERARAFSWERSARAHLEAYTLALAKR